MFGPFKKEKPFQGLTGFGGGATGLANHAGGGGPITATGGTKATPGDGYIYHLFTTSGSLVIDSGDAEMNVLIVGGGGGGGGAGAFRPATLDGKTGTHPITIGEGGVGGTGSPKYGGTGGDTTFTFDSTPYVANGGGGGSGDGSNSGGQPSPGNGSGGGTTGSPLSGSPWTAGEGGDYGNNGRGSPANGTGGGGGGAGSGGPAGNEPATNSSNIPGGNGATLPWIPTAYGYNSTGYFAGGGGGGGNQYPPGSSQSTPPGGGGRGGRDSPGFSAEDAAASTGSGGGGGDGGGTPHRSGGDGADGVVLIRYEA